MRKMLPWLALTVGVIFLVSCSEGTTGPREIEPIDTIVPVDTTPIVFQPNAGQYSITDYWNERIVNYCNDQVKYLASASMGVVENTLIFEVVPLGETFGQIHVEGTYRVNALAWGNPTDPANVLIGPLDAKYRVEGDSILFIYETSNYNWLEDLTFRTFKDGGLISDTTIVGDRMYCDQRYIQMELPQP